MSDVIGKEVFDRFWSKVKILGPDDCWPWQAGFFDTGYGQFSIDGRSRGAHRVAFLIAYGHWPKPCGCHSCDYRPCCNPVHIWEGTRGANARDMAVKDRSSHGSRNGMSKLTEGQVFQILRLKGKSTQEALAKRFGVSRKTVGFIFSGERWGRVVKQRQALELGILVENYGDVKL